MEEEVLSLKAEVLAKNEKIMMLSSRVISGNCKLCGADGNAGCEERHTNTGIVSEECPKSKNT